MDNAKSMWDSVVSNAAASSQPLPATKTWAEFRASIENSTDQGLERISKAYADTFTLDELKTVKAFLQTSAGRKFAVQPGELQNRLEIATDLFIKETENSLEIYLTKEDPK